MKSNAIHTTTCIHAAEKLYFKIKQKRNKKQNESKTNKKSQFTW